MTQAGLEHVNITVPDPAATAAWMEKIFGWAIRWEGDSIYGGHTKHVGNDRSYLAIYNPMVPLEQPNNSYTLISGLNHIGVLVGDLDEVERRVTEHGFKTHSHADYEPGRRFYFHDENGIEFECVEYD